MKIYDENGNLVTNYDKNYYRLDIDKVLLNSYSSYAEVPKEYRSQLILVEDGMYNIYERKGILVARTYDERKELYKKEVRRRIRLKYSIDDEFQVHREQYSEPQAFNEYNEYVELCITESSILYGIDLD